MEIDVIWLNISFGEFFFFCMMGKLDRFDIVFENLDGVCVFGNFFSGFVILEFFGKLKICGR